MICFYLKPLLVRYSNDASSMVQQNLHKGYDGCKLCCANSGCYLIGYFLIQCGQ